MAAPPRCATARDVALALAFVDPTRVEKARADVDARPLAYALGSGEADEVALFAAIKPLVRQVLPPARLAAARVRFEALGLTVGEAQHRVALPSTDGSVLFVGRDPALVREAVRCEAKPDHDRDLGRLLGYPRCCVEAYLDIPTPRRNVDAFARALDASHGVFAPRLNVLDLAIFHYVSWLPCSFACSLSRMFADAVARHIATKHGQFLAGKTMRPARATCPPACRHERFVADIDRALAAHRLLIFEDVQLSLTGPISEGVVRVEHAWPTAWDRPAEATIGDDAREAVARLVAVIETAGTVAVEAGVLYVGEKPALRADDAMLVPFGG